jgi:hypothetical protein
LRIAGLAIAWIVGLGIVAIGLAYAAKSERNAAGFGLPLLLQRDARGWWQVKGVRDIVSGLLIIVAIIVGTAELWWLILVLALIPLGDAVVVLTNGGRKSAALGIHGATAVGMILAAILLAAHG